MSDTFRGVVNRTAQQSVPWWPAPNLPDESSPNVVVVLLDDAGFAHFGCYGAPIETPTFDQLAANGLRFTNFTVAAVCSPTRASLLTGRNHHSVGMRFVANFDTGFPNMRGGLPKRAATMARVLRDVGLRDLRRRQVAHRAGLRVFGGGTVSQLAAGAGIRALLRLSRRRDRPVPSRAGLRQPPDRAARVASKMAITSPKTWSTKRSG